MADLHPQPSGSADGGGAGRSDYLAGASIARAQEVVALVDGEPITKLDICSAPSSMQMSTPKPPSRQEVIDTLIDEILEVREAKTIRASMFPNPEVESSYAGVANAWASTRRS